MVPPSRLPSSEKMQDLLLLNVAHLLLGIETTSVMTALIECNTAVPTKKLETFSTTPTASPGCLSKCTRVSVLALKTTTSSASLNFLVFPLHPVVFLKSRLHLISMPMVFLMFLLLTRQLANQIASPSLTTKVMCQKMGLNVCSGRLNNTKVCVLFILSKTSKLIVQSYLAKEEATTEQIQSKNGLELYSHNLCNSVTDGKLADKFEAGDKVKLGCHQ